MPKSSKNLQPDARSASRRNVSSTKRTPIISKRALSKLRSDLASERNAKNQAYSFILTQGLFQEFVRYMYATHETNHLTLCQSTVLARTAKEEQK